MVGGWTLESVMSHILVGDYTLLQYPHFQPPKKGDSGRRTSSPGNPLPHTIIFLQPRPEWKVPPEYTMAANNFRRLGDPEE
jgi:hypothetical protein